MEQPASKNESELWSYLNNGDGTNCPLNDHCEIQQNSGLCLNNFKDILGGSSGVVPLADTLDSELIDNLNESAGCDFLGNWVPGPIFELIESLANKYIEQSAITQPPVPTRIIDIFGIERPVDIRPVPLKAYQGAVWNTSDGWVIHLDKQSPPGNQRITLFHEIFHIIAHTKSTPVFRKRGIEEGSFNELLADYFAGCILIPQKWVAEKWAETSDLEQMAEIFQVPKLPMWFRLKTMRLL